MKNRGILCRGVLLTWIMLVILSLNAFAQEKTVLETVEEVMEDEEEQAEEKDALEGIGEDTYNLLLIGVDRRNDSWNGNSDVMLLVTVNPEKETVYLTSFLRDLYADIEGVGVRKLNAACAYGGAELCVETIRSNYQVRIDNYALVDFNDMITIVDVLGGVDLELTADEVRVANQYVRTMCEANGEPFEYHQILGSGMLHLDGYQAVGYMRNRYSGSENDFGRTDRQRKVLLAILEKMKSGNLGDLAALMLKVLPHMEHDVDAGTIVKLVTNLPGWLEYEIEQQRIPYDNMYHSENEILIPDMEETIRILQEAIY